MSALADDRKIDEAAQPLTVEAFFDWIEHREERFELVEGVVRMLPNVTRSHANIVSNIDYALQSRLDRSRYMVTQGDFAVQTGPKTVRYADLMVEETNDDLMARKSDSPLLLVEVLSHSTAPLDFGIKRFEYQALPSLQVYMIVDQTRPFVWLFLRDTEGTWNAEPRLIDEGAIPIAVLGVELDLAEIYHRIFSLKVGGGQTG
ncbi:Endonuclease, Uma2 family (restriction endonuclease fold) [Fulvimarina manganoxydans]|uniref:Endonuclease, Uma2 family (Restriction endonuclease fold) n=1 Tax=Fulvimarina manganoxydans TaxID=937218 RepID=A0A1W1ZZH7_9HYPH|nr:Uma2 family endonuclease [Fulvimarina manganoxydans]SMC53468.1 Endonuclease, Uma2 family (restriction endonuclease fold) [Fulvimarina manganoxydans]